MTSPATNVLNYNGYVTQIAQMAVVNVSTVSSVVRGDANFEAIIPQMLNYAELRIERDTDLQNLLTTRSYTLTANNNLFQVPTNDFVTVQTITPDVTGAPLLPVSKEFLQNVYGPGSTTAIPTYFAMYGGDLATAGLTSVNVTVGPIPDQNYAVTVAGTIRMPTLYSYATTQDAATGTTFISTWLPDLLIQASMIYIAQYQRNFLPTSNDPQMPGSYEVQYQTLLKGALVEEARKRFAAPAWASMSPTTIATPGRGA